MTRPIVSSITLDANDASGLLNWVFSSHILVGFLFFLKINFIYLFIYFGLRRVLIVACGLSLVGGERGPLFAAVRRLFILVASLVAEHSL